jgi:trimethylamine--corrinoid protein Co-methyltransferase
MGRPKLNFLSEAELEAVHRASVEILEKTGVSVGSRKALDVLKSAGATVDDESVLVKIPKSLVEEALKRAPRRIKYCGRNPENDFELNTGEPHFCADGGYPFVYDWRTGKRKYSTREDMAANTIIADYLDHVDLIWLLGGCGDVPEPLLHIYNMVTTLRNTGKHFEGDSTNAREAEYQVEIAATIVGGRGQLRARPIFSMVNCTIAPLRFDKGMTEAGLKLAEAGVPLVVYPMPVSGVSGPITLAGTMAVSNAEFLAGLVIYQFAVPGAPIVYTTDTATADFRTGAAIHSAEGALMNLGLTQLARHYDLPRETAIMSTASKLNDAQGGYEKAIDLVPWLLSEPDILLGLGALESCRSTCPETLIIDNEIIDYAIQYSRGLEVNEETLALAVIQAVGPRGNYLGERHTVGHFRERWKSRIADIDAFEVWEKQGSKQLHAVATEKVREILTTHKPEPFSDALEQEIGYILKKAEEEKDSFTD